MREIERRRERAAKNESYKTASSAAKRRGQTTTRPGRTSVSRSTSQEKSLKRELSLLTTSLYVVKLPAEVEEWGMVTAAVENVL